MKKALIFPVFLLLWLQLSADNYYGKRINIDEGLSQSSVTSITCDNNGSLWIGTRFGLNEYRNGTIRSFIRDEADGISGNYINCLYCDSEDRMWVSTDRGVFVYDRHSEQFSMVSPDPASCFREKGDTLYFGGLKGIARYSLSTETFTEDRQPVDTDVLELLAYGDTLVCVGRAGGISLCHEGRTERIGIPEIAGMTLMSASRYENAIVLALLGEGIIVYDLGRHKVLRRLRPGENGLCRELILTTQPVGDRIWLGTDGNGIMVLDPKTWEVSGFLDDNSVMPGTDIPSSVTSVYTDPKGNIWLGGVFFGLTGLRFSTIHYHYPDLIINWLFLSEDGNMYIGTDGNGISRFTDGVHLPFASTDKLKITSIADYDSRDLVFCAYNQGFFLMDRKTGVVRPFIIIDARTNAEECLYGYAPAIYRLDDGRLLIYAVNTYVHNPADGSFVRIADQTGGRAKGLHGVKGDCTGIYSYSKTGIFRTDLESLCVKGIFTATKEIGSINAAACLDSTLAFGTDYGLFIMNLNSGETTPVHTGLFNRVTELRMDKNRQLWIGADNSLFLYKDNSFEIYGRNRGVPANEITTSALGDNGAVYLGGSNGFFEISDRNDIGSAAQNKVLSLYNVSINGKKVDCTGGKITSSHHLEDLGVRIAQRGADPLEKTLYKYNVEGPVTYSVETFEDNIRLQDLKPGKYTIKASCLQSGGGWSESCQILEIRVMRPWYISVLMIVIYSLLAAAGILQLILYEQKKATARLLESYKTKESAFITKFQNYITDHLSDSELNVDGIAAALAMSRASLYAKVKQSFSTGVSQYIEAERMNRAQELLTTTTLSVAEIADAAGYSTSRYFSIRFKAYTGSSPLTYRKESHLGNNTKTE